MIKMLGKILTFFIVWIGSYTIFAILFTIPFAFAFWDIKILTESIMFWSPPTGGAGLFRLICFLFSFAAAIASTEQY